MIKKLNIPVICTFIILFVYGALLLMIGYTQEGIRSILGTNSNPLDNSTMVFLLIGQSCGLIISTIVLGKLIKIFNIRYIFATSFFIAIIITILISQFDKFTTNMSTIDKCVIYVFLTLLFGFAIGPTSPLASTFLSAVYNGHMRTKMLSISNGIYGIGAGLAALAMVVGFFINYKHTKQQTSSKILDANQKHFDLKGPLLCVVFLMTFYIITETIVNYTFKSASQQAITSSSNPAVIATMAFGLFVMAQGIWRAFAGLFLVTKIKAEIFIITSAIVLFSGFIFVIIPDGLSTTTNVFITSILLGLGLGNLWPVIFSYAVSIDERRSSFIGIVINVVSMFWIPVTQVIIACILLNGQVYQYVWIFGLVTIVLIISFTIITSLFLKHFHKKHNINNNQIRKVS